MFHKLCLSTCLLFCLWTGAFAQGKPELVLKGGNAFVGDAEYFKEGNPEGFGFAVFVAGISPGFAEKQCPRFNFVPVKTHLTPMKVSSDVNGKLYIFFICIYLWM